MKTQHDAHGMVRTDDQPVRQYSTSRAFDTTFSNPANSVPSEVAGVASVDSNSAPVPDSALAQLFELADSPCACTYLARGNLAAGAGPEILPAPAAFFPDICELLSYAQGGLFYPVSPRDETDSLPSGESDPAVTLDFPRGESICSPPLFLTDASFEFLESVAARGGLA